MQGQESCWPVSGETGLTEPIACQDSDYDGIPDHYDECPYDASNTCNRRLATIDLEADYCELDIKVVTVKFCEKDGYICFGVGALFGEATFCIKASEIAVNTCPQDPQYCFLREDGVEEN